MVGRFGDFSPGLTATGTVPDFHRIPYYKLITGMTFTVINGKGMEILSENPKIK